jgi:hypothetical protein
MARRVKRGEKRPSALSAFTSKQTSQLIWTQRDQKMSAPPISEVAVAAGGYVRASGLGQPYALHELDRARIPGCPSIPSQSE